MAAVIGDPNCSQCAKDVAEFKCLDCETDLCKRCSKYHLKIPTCKNHTIKELNSKSVVCLMCDGDEGCPLKVFCKDCKGFLCSECSNFHTKIKSCTNHLLRTITTDCCMCSNKAGYFCPQCSDQMCEQCNMKHLKLPSCKTHEVALLQQNQIYLQEIEGDHTGDILGTNKQETNNLSADSISRESKSQAEVNICSSKQELCDKNNIDSSNISEVYAETVQGKEENKLSTEIEQIKEFHAKDLTFCSISLCWKEVNNVDEYQLTLNADGKHLNFCRKENYFTIPELEPSTKYVLQIRGIKDNVEGPSTMIDAMTKDLPTIEGFTLNESTMTTMTLSWNAVDGVDRYELSISDREQTYDVQPDVCEFIIKDLAPDRKYKLTLCTVKGSTKGSKCQLVGSTEAIPHVKHFKAKSTHSSIKLTWEKVDDIDRYKIVLGDKEVTFTVNSDVDHIFIPDLSPSEEYSFEICAVKGETDGQITSLDTTIKEIPMVKGFRVGEYTLSTISIYWESLPDVEGYEIKSPGRENVILSAGSDTRYTLKDLIQKQKYTVTICALMKSKKGPENSLQAETAAIPKVDNIITAEQSLVSVTLSWLGFPEDDSLEIWFNGRKKFTAPTNNQNYGIKIPYPENCYVMNVSHMKEDTKEQHFDWKINPKNLPDTGLGDPVSMVHVQWRHIDDVDRYEVTEAGKPPCYIDDNSYTVMNSSPGKEFTLQIAAMKGEERGKPVIIKSKAQFMEHYRQYRFHQLLQIYGLHHFLENPIDLKDLLLIDAKVVQEFIPEKAEDLPYYIFHKIMMLNYKARSAQVHTEAVQALNSSIMPGSPNESILDLIAVSGQHEQPSYSTQVHPTDLLLAMFYCSNMFVQQYFVTKLSQCQLSLPFLIHNPYDFKLVFPLWAFRSIKKGWCTKNTSASETSEVYENQHMANAKSKVISFIRFGKSQYSKSELMNLILSRNHDIFIHRNSKGSTENRILLDGTAEMSWYLPSGKKDDVFSELVTFVNLRGDADFLDTETKFLCGISTVVVIVLAHGENYRNIASRIERFNPNIEVMYVIEDLDAKMTMKDKTWYFGVKKVNKSEITDVIQQSLQSIIANAPQDKALTLAECAARGKRDFQIHCDEDNQQCKHAKKIVDKVMKEIISVSDFEVVKENMLPLQGKEWFKWSETKKKINRPRLEKNETVIQYEEKLTKQMQQLRCKQTSKGLPPNQLMRDVIVCLSEESSDVKKFFLQWIKFELDSLSAKKLVKLNTEFNSLWSKTEKFKRDLQNEVKDKKVEAEEKIKQEQKIKEMVLELQTKNEQIIASSIGTEHLFREMSQMYECMLDKNSPFPELKTKLPAIAADLLLDGQAIELMDGDAGHVPCEWISSVLSLVAEKCKTGRKQKERIFVLTVLGIQSSGKSTLLNAMFGLQFTVSAGRCTKGAYMQLLKVSDEMQQRLDYEYVLVIDTEGLRSSELYSTTTQTRDNELATFVIGLGDVTLINIFGENPSDMNDILQIVVQAFLRMKKVNFKPRCYFVHQNVGAVDAKDKLKAGRRNMIDKLNEMTKVAAEQEGSCEQYFSEVIAFDQDHNFCYLSSLWEGDPPMAPPNPGYSEKIQSLKCLLLNLPATEQVSCLKIRDLNKRILDIWNGLLCENFVFNFKNTLEISVYRQVESKFNQWRWQMYKCIEEEQDKALNIIDNARGDKQIFAKVKMDIQQAVDGTYQNIKEEADEYFNNSDQRHVSVQWKGKIEIQLENTKKELLERAKGYCEEFLNGQVTTSKIDQSIAGAENIFFRKAKELAQKISEGTTEEERTLVFNKAWADWLVEISLSCSSIEKINVWQAAEHSVLNTFANNTRYITGKLLQTPLTDVAEFILDLETHVQRTRRQRFNQTFQFWKTFDSSGRLNEEAKSILKDADSRLEKMKAQGVNKYKPGAERYFMAEIKFVEDSVKSFQQGMQDVRLTELFTIDLVLVVISRTAYLLQELHRQYISKHDPLVIIEEKKSNIYDTFLKYIKGTDAGIVGADIWIGKLKTAVWKAFMKKTAGVVNDFAMTNMPPFNGNRSNLDLHMKRHLVEKENFMDYMNYVRLPQNFVEIFTYRCIEQESFTINEGLNPNILEAFNCQIEILYEHCIDANEKAKAQSKNDAVQYVLKFQNYMQQYLSLGTAVDSFIEHAGEISKQCLDFFLQQLEERLPQLKEHCDENLENLVADPDLLNSVIITASSEVSNFFTSQCCWETCPFCREMCTNTIKGHKEDHSVMFHKPQGIGGWYYKKSNCLVVEHCTYLVKSNRRFYPGPDDDDDTLVEYKRYKTAGDPYSRWSITADDSMKKHWQWFTVRFKRDIDKFHHREMTDIPDSWKNVTKEEVMEELMTQTG